jgi:hypothetical protein
MKQIYFMLMEVCLRIGEKVIVPHMNIQRYEAEKVPARCNADGAFWALLYCRLIPRDRFLYQFSQHECALAFAWSYAATFGGWYAAQSHFLIPRWKRPKSFAHRRRRPHAAAADWAAPNFAVQQQQQRIEERGQEREREGKKLHLLAVSIAKIVANFLTTGQQRRPSKKRDIHPTTVLTTAAFAARFPPNKCEAFVSLFIGQILFSLAPVWLSETNIFSELGAKTRWGCAQSFSGPKFVYRWLRVYKHFSGPFHFHKSSRCGPRGFARRQSCMEVY